MNCEQMTLLISAWLDGETAPQEEKQLMEHLDRCAPCRELLEQLQTLRASFSELEEIPAPEDFADRVMERVRAESKPQPKVVPLFRRPHVRALTGLAACAVLCVGLMSGTGRKSAEMMAPASAPAALAPDEAPAARAPESFGLTGSDAENGLFDVDYSAKMAEEPAEVSVESAVSTPEITTEPAMEPAVPAPGEGNAPVGAPVYDGLREDESRVPEIRLTTLPAGMEELGELRWEAHEDGTASVSLTGEQADRLLELLAEQGLEGLISMPAGADETTWLLVLGNN